MLEAATASGVAYATLRDLYNGTTVNPGIKTLDRLSKAYGIHPSWFTDDRQPEEVPSSGLLVTLREKVPGPRGPVHREVLIPLAAYPLPWVLGEGMLILEALPPSEDRPILGTAEGEEANFRMADAVLAPLLTAESAGLIPPLQAVIDERSEGTSHLVMMRHLGRLWKAILESPLHVKSLPASTGPG